jgi:tetratricopeptide (TPR) repeat protein
LGALTAAVNRDGAGFERVEHHLRRASELNPRFPLAYVRLAAMLERRDEKLAEASSLVQRAMEVDSQTVGYRLLLGRILRKLNRAGDAAYAVTQDVRLATMTHAPGPANYLCWEGSLAGFADFIIKACELAVRLAPDNGGFRDSRGLARALTGDLQGAIEDFRFFLEWGSGREPEKELDRRRAWIAELEAGRNPFDRATLESLAASGWP